MDIVLCQKYSNIMYVGDTAPFKFDVPSPDDLVSNGLRSKKDSKGILLWLQMTVSNGAVGREKNPS